MKSISDKDEVGVVKMSRDSLLMVWGISEMCSARQVLERVIASVERKKMTVER